MNPGGSVKDRAALAIITDARARGVLRPGGTIVEGTAGNTGIGLTLVANARGYRSVIVMPDTQSQEKIDFLRMIGADLRLVPAKPYSDPGNYVHCRQPPGRGDGRRCGPTSSTTWPTGKATAPPPGRRSGSRPAAGGRLHLRLRHRRHPGRGVAGAEGEQAGRPDRAGRPGRQRPVWLGQAGRPDVAGSSITEGIGQSRVTGNLDGVPSTTPCASRMPRRWSRCSTCCARGPVGRRLGRDQRRGGDPRGARPGAGPHGGDDPVRRRRALPVQAVQPGVPAGKGLPVPDWLAADTTAAPCA